MNMTINDIMKKLDRINRCVEALEKKDLVDSFDLKQFDIDDAIDLLVEYKDMILNTKIDI